MADFVAVILAAREGVKGGESRVFDAEGLLPALHADAAWTTLLLDDERVIHETRPSSPPRRAATATR